MPVDTPKHPSMYPIWMRRAIEQALAKKNLPWAVDVTDDAHERSLRRNFRAYVKALRRQQIPQWTPKFHEEFCDATFTLRRIGDALYLEAKPGRKQAELERLTAGNELAQVIATDPGSGEHK